jgi:signal transduction histidine kinase
MMHETGNPLEALNNLLYLGLETADEPKAVRRYLRLAQEQAATLNEITSSILGFAKSSRRLKATRLVALVKARAQNPQESD